MERISSYNQLQKVKEEAHAFWMHFPQKFIHGRHNFNASGDYLNNCKNVTESWNVMGSEDSKWCQFLMRPTTKDCYDYTIWGNNAERMYECSICGLNSKNFKFCWECWESFDLEYSIMCQNSSNLFGCIALRSKQYCIFNKQYSKEAYLTLVPKIIRHMNEMPYKDSKGRTYTYGEFFPTEFSPYAYNQTIAQEHFPLNEQAAKEEEYWWQEEREKNHQPTMRTENIPDAIGEIDENVLQETLGCLHDGTCSHQCTKAFRIIPFEFQFLKQSNLPLPRLCPNCRHGERIRFRNPMQTQHRTCACAGSHSSNDTYQNTGKHFHGDASCPNEFETTYAPQRLEIVYCEQCYQAEVA